MRVVSSRRWRRRQSASTRLVEPTTDVGDALQTLPSGRLAVTLRALACIVALTAVTACSDPRQRRGADHVPASWSEVRETAGHQVHVGGHHIACRDCHEDGFSSPPADLCSSCHAGVQATIHLDFGLATQVPVPASGLSRLPRPRGAPGRVHALPRSSARDPSGRGRSQRRKLRRLPPSPCRAIPRRQAVRILPFPAAHSSRG